MRAIVHLAWEKDTPLYRSVFNMSLTELILFLVCMHTCLNRLHIFMTTRTITFGTLKWIDINAGSTTQNNFFLLHLILLTDQVLADDSLHYEVCLWSFNYHTSLLLFQHS